MFYAVHIGRIPAVYRTWEQCKAQVERFPGARFRKFEKAVDALFFVKFGHLRPDISGEQRKISHYWSFEELET